MASRFLCDHEVLRRFTFGSLGSRFKQTSGHAVTNLLSGTPSGDVRFETSELLSSPRRVLQTSAPSGALLGRQDLAGTRSIPPALVTASSPRPALTSYPCWAPRFQSPAHSVLPLGSHGRCASRIAGALSETSGWFRCCKSRLSLVVAKIRLTVQAGEGPVERRHQDHLRRKIMVVRILAAAHSRVVIVD